MTRLSPSVFDIVAAVLLGPPAIIIAIAFYMYWQNISYPSTQFIDPYAVSLSESCKQQDCQIPIFHPGDLVRMNYTIKRNRACTLNISRIMEDVGGRFENREHQVDYTEQTFGPELVSRPSGYTFEVPKSLPDDDRVKCQQYDVFSRVRYFCNALDQVIPRFMMTDGKRETKRVRIDVCR